MLQRLARGPGREHLVRGVMAQHIVQILKAVYAKISSVDTHYLQIRFLSLARGVCTCQIPIAAVDSSFHRYLSWFWLLRQVLWYVYQHLRRLKIECLVCCASLLSGGKISRSILSRIIKAVSSLRQESIRQSCSLSRSPGIQRDAQNCCCARGLVVAAVVPGAAVATMNTMLLICLEPLTAFFCAACFLSLGVFLFPLRCRLFSFFSWSTLAWFA